LVKLSKKKKMKKIQVTIKQLMNDLENGLTRYRKDDFGNGSIEEKYNLTKAQVARIFKNEKLKGLKVKGKTRVKDNFELIDDFVTEQEEMQAQLTGMIDTSFDINDIEEPTITQSTEVDINQL